MKVYDYWLKTFDNFVTAVLTATDEAERNNLNKLGLLASFLSHRTFELIADATEYDQAIAMLRNTYPKSKNVIFARHLLLSRTQKSNESLAEFVHALKQLARDCEFRAVSADKYRDELTRDAFINGINSVSIRQRLLEEDGLTFQNAINKAETLDRAQKQSEFYESKPMLQSAAITNDPSAGITNDPESKNQGGVSTRITTKQKQQRKCYFCGGIIHSGGRNQCPAKNQICNNCGKKGHFKRVCKSIPKTTLA